MTAETTQTANTAKNPANNRTAGTLVWRFRYVLIGLAVAMAAVPSWEGLKYRIIAKRWGVVTEGKIFRSGQVSKWMLEKKLKEHGIQVVVDLTGLDLNDEHQQSEIETAKKLGIEHHRFPLQGDGTGDIHNYVNAIAVIVDSESHHKPVLVHCAAGAQRTGCAVAAYRVLVLKQSPQKAYAELSRYGWKAHKDQAMLRYLNSHMQELAQLLVARGIIERIPNPLPVVEP